MSKTVLKARYGSELRKNWIYHNNDVSLDDLISKMQRYFDIKELDGIKLKYRDEEEDWITLVNDDDLSFALSTMEILYVEVFSDDSKTTKEEKSCNFDVKVSESNTDTMQKQLTGATKQMSIEQLTDIPLNHDQVPHTLQQNGGLRHQPAYTGGGVLPPVQQPSYVGGGVMPPPVVSNFGPPPTSQQMSPPPTSQQMSLPPTSQQLSGVYQQSYVGGVLPPPVSSFGPPPTSHQMGHPPTSQHMGYPPTSQRMGGVQQQPSYIGGPPPHLSEQLTDIPLGQVPPTSQQMCGVQQQLSYAGGGVLPPVQQPSYAGGVLPPPVSNFGPMPTSQQMGHAPTSQQQMSGVQQPSYVGGAIPPPPIVSSIGLYFCLMR
uniref:PB1 domain-containing protein n=1 Tax=Meloidogyne hapla TaxID=6305 RepID=A0A1I8AXQ6_MELHA